MKMWKITIYKIPVQGGKKVAQHFEAGKLLLQVSSIDLLPLLPPVVSLKASSKPGRLWSTSRGSTIMKMIMEVASEGKKKL